MTLRLASVASLLPMMLAIACGGDDDSGLFVGTGGGAGASGAASGTGGRAGGGSAGAAGASTDGGTGGSSTKGGAGGSSTKGGAGGSSAKGGAGGSSAKGGAGGSSAKGGAGGSSTKGGAGGGDGPSGAGGTVAQGGDGGTSAGGVGGASGLAGQAGTGGSSGESGASGTAGAASGGGSGGSGVAGTGGQPANGECTDEHEPDDNEGSEHRVSAIGPGDPLCETHTICAKDTDLIELDFYRAEDSKKEYGVLSATVKVVAGVVEAPVEIAVRPFFDEQAVPKKHVIKSTGKEAAVVSEGWSCDADKSCFFPRFLVSIESLSTTPVTYTFCAEVD